MKKFFAFLLAMALALPLAACGGTPQTNPKKVDVTGTWIDTSPLGFSGTLTLNADGTGTGLDWGRDFSFVWERKGDQIIISIDMGPFVNQLLYTVRLNGDLVELVSEGLLADGTKTELILVRDQHFQTMFETVEITPENWQQYFEINPLVEPVQMGDGTTSLYLYPVMKLKDEWSDAYPSFGTVSISCTGWYICLVEYNFSTNTFQLGTPFTEAELDAKKYHGYDNTQTSDLFYYDPEFGFRIANPSGIWGTEKMDGVLLSGDMQWYDNIEITDIQTTLYLKK